MSYKLIFLTLLFLLSINNISANQSRRLLQTEPPDDTETTQNKPFDIDDTDTDDATEGTEGTDDTDDGTGTDTDDGTNDTDDDTENDTENDTGDDNEDDGEEDMDEDADDNTETTSEDEDIDDEDIDNEIDINSEDEIDCENISSEHCGEEVDDDGDPICTYNGEKKECFSIVRKAGSLGHGNYDDGYNAAQQTAGQDHDELNIVIGILGGLIGVLSLVIIGGIYWIWKNNLVKSNTNSMEFIDD
eukprot:865441_1